MIRLCVIKVAVEMKLMFLDIESILYFHQNQMTVHPHVHD